MVDPVSMELLSDAVVLVTADDYRKLQVENIRLTRELDEARKQSVRAQGFARRLCQPMDLNDLDRLRSDAKWFVASIDGPSIVGPLPAAPNEAEPK